MNDIEAQERPSVSRDAAETPCHEAEAVSRKRVALFSLSPERPLPPSPSFVCRAEGVNSGQIDVLLALLPLLLWSCYLYGFRPLTLAAIAVVAAFLSEGLGRLILRRTAPMELSFAVTGMTVALCLPPTAPLWLPAVGAGIAVFFFRQLFGGWGRELFPPTAAAVAILWLVFPALMRGYAATGQTLPAFTLTVESYTAASPLPQMVMQSGFLPEESLGSLFVGLGAGMMGQTSALLLLAAGLFLMIRRVRRITVSMAFVLTVAVLSYLFPTLTAVTDIMALRYVGYQLISGDLLYGVIFLSSEPVTVPRTKRAQWLYGILGGTVTVLMRRYADPAVSVIAATLVISLLSRPLDLLLCPVPFGGRRRLKRAKATVKAIPAESDAVLVSDDSANEPAAETASFADISSDQEVSKAPAEESAEVPASDPPSVAPTDTLPDSPADGELP